MHPLSLRAKLTNRASSSCKLGEVSPLAVRTKRRGLYGASPLFVLILSAGAESLSRIILDSVSKWNALPLAK